MRYPNDIRAWIKARLPHYFAIVLLLLTAVAAFGQNRKELIEERQRLMKEIKETETLLEKTQENKAAALDRYFALQNQIQRRQQLINTLQAEINYANESIQRSHQVLSSLNNDIERLKREYGTMLRVAYRHKLSNSWLVFLFSANGMNDAFRRWQYIRQYHRFRQRQADLIGETQQMLIGKTEHLENTRKEKEELLLSEEQQKSQLDQELKDKDDLLENLKADEGRLVAELESQREAHEKLNTAIERIILEEMARKRKESREPGALSASAESSADAANMLSGSFTRNKGRLPWPVADGEITRHFGTQPHPTIKSVQITNNGIDIATTPHADVFSVFSGKVAGTQFIPGYQYMVIMQHGQYYTVYSNLEEIYVKRGDELDAQQTLGRVGSDKSEVHFEVWREKQRLNPVHWVDKR